MQDNLKPLVRSSGEVYLVGRFSEALTKQSYNKGDLVAITNRAGKIINVSKVISLSTNQGWKTLVLKTVS